MAGVAKPRTREPGSAGSRSQNGRELLTAEEVAEITGMGVDWIYEQSRLGRIKTVKLGRYRRFRREAVDAWIRSLEE